MLKGVYLKSASLSKKRMSDEMKKVLVIEDNETNLYLMRTIVEKLGHQVIEARDGFDGVELAISKKPFRPRTQ